MEMETFLPPQKKTKKTNSLRTLLRNRNIFVIAFLSIVVGGWVTWLTLKVRKEALSETDMDFAGIYKLYSRKIFQKD